MKGNERVVELLNEALRNELTAVNQYWLHYRLLDNWGVKRLAEFERHESIDEMKHAETLTDRILFLEGLPNYQRIGTLQIGQTVPEQFRADLVIEYAAVDRLRPGIAYMREKGDVTSALIFEAILADEEQHIDYLETQLDLIQRLGEPLYLAGLVHGS